MTDLARAAAGTLVVPDGAPPPVRLAARELQRYLARIAGVAPRTALAAAGDGHWLWLGDGLPAALPAAPGGAQWSVVPGAGGVALRAETPRGVLAAAYALLEAAGCRWSPRGAAGEQVPDPATADRTVRPLAGRPAFARRAWASDLATWHYSMPERLAARLPADLAFVDWLAKVDATGWLFIRHANDTQWLVPELVPALRERGLEIEWGGHALPELLPRAHFATHPDWFPMDGAGARTDWGNVCTANPDALAAVRAGVRTARAGLPDAGDLHAWGLDLFGGGWCRCPACAALSPSDQALRLANALAEEPAAGSRVFHLAYHDTIRPPRTVRPHARVWGEFAPRERCYAHPIDAADCPTNARYHAALVGHLELFAGRVDVFEYYADAILFCGCAAPLVELVARDLDAYRRLGVRGVSCLAFGEYSVLAYGPNLHAFARGVVAPAAATTGHDAHDATLAPFRRRLERLVAGALRWGDVKIPPAAPARAAVALRGFETALAEADALRAMLLGRTTPLARAEAALLDYTLGTFAALRDVVRARLAGDAAALDAALRALQSSTDALVATADPHLGTWGLHDLPLAHAFHEAALRAGHALPDPFRDAG